MVITRGVLFNAREPLVFFCSSTKSPLYISCQQHTIPAPPQNIHIQTQQKSGGKYDVRPGLYTEPGGDPPGLLPTNKAGALKVAKENYQPDIIDILVHNQPSFQREATPNRQGAASASYFGFPKAIIPHLYSTLLPQVSGRQQTDCAGAHHGNLTPPRISPSCPHCVILQPDGFQMLWTTLILSRAVAGQEYHYTPFRSWPRRVLPGFYRLPLLAHTGQDCMQDQL